MAKLATNTRRSGGHYGQLQRVVDSVFADGGKFVRRLDVVVTAESFDLPDDLDEIIALLPPGTYYAPTSVRSADLGYRRTCLGSGVRYSVE